MAKTFGNLGVGIPTDQPITIRPGITHREVDFHGNAHHLAIPPEHPERAAKGDLGLSVISDFEPRPLSTPEPPFANLRKDK
jgi:hypothetical protein